MGDPRRPWLLLLVLSLSGSTAVGGDSPGNDPFGIAKLHRTAPQGREWLARWDKSRSIDGYGFDPADPLFRNSAEVVTIANGIASAPAGLTRFYVLTPKADAKSTEPAYTAAPWKNVEMTIYVKCGEPTRRVSGQALTLSARSGEQHNDRAPCDGTSYHATLRFDGRAGFKKEVWHTGGYTELQPDPAPRLWDTVPRDRWIGIKFVCRNCDDERHVRLQHYLDDHDRNEWKLVAEFTDRGGWEGKQAGCDRPQDYIIAEARPAVYFRTDSVPVDVRRFSVREIEPLP